MLTWFLIVSCTTFAYCSCIVSYSETPIDFSSVIISLNQVIDSYVTNSSVVFFLDEIQRLPWTDSLLKIMSKPKLVVRKEHTRALYGFYVLFPALSPSYRLYFRDRIHSRSKFLLVWPENVELLAVTSMFEDFWYHKYINVVAMVGTASNDTTFFRFYAFDPYSAGKCGTVSQPYIIAEWTSTSKRFSNYQQWFPRRLRNLAGCTLKAIGNHQPPDNIMYYFNGRWRAKGVGSKILRVAESYLNFSSIIQGVQLNVSLDHIWYYFEREIYQIKRAIEDDRVDFAFGWYSFANMEMKNFDVTLELGRISSIDCFGWAVPYRAGNKPPNVTYYVNEFKLVSWTLILATLCVCTTLFHLASPHCDFVSASLVVWRTFLEQPVPGMRAHRYSASFRTLFAGFCFYSLVVSAAYKASFSSFLSVPNQGREFKSVRDILNSTLHIRGSPLMLKIINESAGHTSMGKAVLSRFETQWVCDYAQIMRQMVRKRDIALLSVKRKMYYYAISEAKRIRVKIPFRFIPGCLVRPHTTHFMYGKGSHLAEPLNVVLNRLFESGITTYWILHLGTNRILPLERLKGRTLKMFFLKEPLLMLVAGYVVASGVLIGEIVLHERSVRKLKQMSLTNRKK